MTSNVMPPYTSNATRIAGKRVYDYNTGKSLVCAVRGDQQGYVVAVPQESGLWYRLERWQHSNSSPCFYLAETLDYVHFTSARHMWGNLAVMARQNAL